MWLVWKIFVRIFVSKKKRKNFRREKNTHKERERERELSKILRGDESVHREKNTNNTVVFIHAWWYIIYNKPRLSVFLQLFPERRLPRK